MAWYDNMDQKRYGGMSLEAAVLEMEMDENSIETYRILLEKYNKGICPDFKFLAEMGLIDGANWIKGMFKTYVALGEQDPNKYPYNGNDDTMFMIKCVRDYRKERNRKQKEARKAKKGKA